MTMTTRPRMTGSAPLSPLRTRAIQILTYSPSEFATTSGAASGGGPWTSVLTGAPWLLSRNSGEALRGTCGHEVDDGLGVVLRRWPDGDQAAQAQHGDPVR